MRQKKHNPAVEELASEAKAHLAVLTALEKKAENLALLNIGELSSFADYFLICSGRSNKQVQAIADAIGQALKQSGAPPLGVEGYREGKWVLIDADDLIIHVFHEPIRSFYNLESLWHQAARVDLLPWEEEARGRAGA
ncbi:MAG: ribosome silencing factor [Deltaproteobacteria bacterium]|nr:ribosome silencing factor [Deltaproteobacteria bacterium]